MSDDKSTINARVSTDNSSDLLLDNKDVMCPVCKEVFVLPRTYDCGHTICELCMYEMDRRDTTDDTHTAEVHHCPICRHATLKSWHNRPLSVLIEKIASSHPNYLTRKREVLETKSKREGSIKLIPRNIDLTDISHTSRLKLALSLYEVLLERLYKAALRGLSYLIIKEKSIVTDIEKVIDLLSVQLFSRHNIYKIMVTRGECTIYIHKDAFSWRRAYENSNWENPGLNIEDNLPSSPVRNSSLSGVLSSLLINVPTTSQSSSPSSSSSSSSSRTIPPTPGMFLRRHR